MSNKILIRRSATNAVIPSLSNGELAFTQAGNTLFIGAPDGTSGNIRIGGQMVPGTLTANQALVANSISQIDKIMTANLVANGSIWANGGVGTSTWVLTSGGAGSNAYWAAAPATVAGSNSQVQFNANGSLAGDDGFTYDGVSNTLTVNGAINVGTVTTINTTAVKATLFVGNVSGTYANITGQVNTATLYVTTSANVGTYFVANSTLVNSAVNVSITGVNTYITSNVTLTSANIDATSALLRVQNINASGNVNISGNLTVTGTVTAINTQQLTVNDSIIEVGSNNTTADTIDTGWFSPAGNSTATWYSGLLRDSGSSSNNNAYFRLFSSNANPNTVVGAFDWTAGNTTTGTLQAYLRPYNSGVAFVANSSTVTLTANATVNVNITANSLSLSTALAATSGGTGQKTYNSGDLLVANTGNALSTLGIGSDGYVLQVSGTSVVYSYLDGGSF